MIQCCQGCVNLQTPGAILEDIPVHDDMASWNVAGSTIVVSAQSREAIIEQLQSDVYATEGVWDLSKVSQHSIRWKMIC